MSKTEYNFPKIDMTGKTIVRQFSFVNPWIDMIVVVNEADSKKAKNVISDAMDAYWNYEFECYGDAIEAYLEEAGILHQSVYHDADDDTQEYEDAWEEYIDSLYKRAVSFRNGLLTC